MEIDRRSFLRMLAAALGVLSGRRARARLEAPAPEIHRTTRNTRFGPLRGGLFEQGELDAFKPYPGLERISLPPLETPPGLSLARAVHGYAPARGFEPASLPLGQLGRLLYFTNGVTGAVRGGTEVVPLRAAPSAGALYAGEVYVVAERIGGLASGVYYYDVHRHALVPLRRGTHLDEVARALERPARIESAAAVVLLTNVFARYDRRYGNRGYRYDLIDSGHIGENLRLAAASAGLGDASPLRFFDDRLNRLIEVDGREESVCALHAVGRPKASQGAPARPVRSLVEQQSAPGFSLPGAGAGPASYHEATKLVPGEGPAPPPPPETDLPGSASSSHVALPRRREPPQASVEATIRQRRSALRFSSARILLEDLGFVLDLAGHATLRRSEGVEVYVVAHRVVDLAPGLYRLAPGEQRLGLLRPGDLSGPLVRACMRQEKAGDAAAGVLAVARLAPTSRGPGPRRYRDQLIEAGAVAQRVYLAAEASGLSARNLAAFVDDDLNELVGLDGRHRAVIHLTLLGHGC